MEGVCAVDSNISFQLMFVRIHQSVVSVVELLGVIEEIKSP